MIEEAVKMLLMSFVLVAKKEVDEVEDGLMLRLATLVLVVETAKLAFLDPASVRLRSIF